MGDEYSPFYGKPNSLPFLKVTGFFLSCIIWIRIHSTPSLPKYVSFSTTQLADRILGAESDLRVMFMEKFVI
jgi:hypothetical protein